MRHPLTDTYRTGRETLLAIGDTLAASDAAVMTSACPAWSIKDVFAHLAGISTDILSGNTEGAATEAWADGHVAQRLDASFADVLEEWRVAGAGVSDVMEQAGDAFPFQLFVDQWTHEWDIRATLGESAAAAPDTTVFEHYLDTFIELTTKDVPAGLPMLQVQIGDEAMAIGSGEPVGTLNLDLFDYARISMGRRSQSQLDALSWPQGLTDTAPYVGQLVLWSVNEHDVLDPTI